jgi:predicted metal-dependent TIM-barrel fold hydrolase
VAVGEVGYDAMTQAEDDSFGAQLALAAEHGLPALVHTPHRDKLEGTKRSLDVVAESGLAPERVLIDHNNELTVGVVAGTGCWMGFSIYPHTKMDEHRMVHVLREYGLDRMIVNSAADWGRSDPLKVARTARAMAEAGFTADEVDKVVWRNPVAFFSQSGRLEVDPPLAVAGAAGSAGAPSSYEGNVIARGEPVEA